MPGPLPRFNHGDSILKALDAGFLNNVVDRLNAIPPKPRTVKESKEPKSTVECYVINNTSAAFPERSVVAITTIGLTIGTDDDILAFQERPLFEIDVPAAASDFPMVCLEPILANGGIGKVAIGGIAICTVNVTDAGHEYANPTSGDETRMTSGATGQVRILYKPSGTGNKTCVVYLVEPSITGGEATCVDVNTYDDLEIPTAWTHDWNPETCEMTSTPTLTSYRWTLSGNTCTDLTMVISETP